MSLIKKLLPIALLLILISLAYGEETITSNNTLSLQNNYTYHNITFSQEPYIVSALLDLYLPLFYVREYQYDGYDITCTDAGDITDCANADDNDYTTYAFDNSVGDTETIDIDFINYENYTAPILYYMYGSGDDNMGVQCYDYQTTQWVSMRTFSSAGSAPCSNYENTIAFPSTCIRDGYNLTVRFQIQLANTCMRLYDAEVYQKYNMTFEMDSESFLNVDVNTTTAYNFNISDNIKANTDDALSSLVFHSNLTVQGSFNYTIELIYNTSIYFRILDELTGNLINATCTYNGDSLGTNETFNVTYVSSEENILRCINEPEWANTSYTVSYPFSEINFTLRKPQAFECTGIGNEVLAYNFTVIDEDNWTILTDNNIFIDLTTSTDTYLSFQRENVSSIAICIVEGQSYLVDGNIQIQNGYNTFYFLRDASFNNESKYIDVYNKADASDYSLLLLTVRDESFLPNANKIGRLERYFPANHSWITVQQDLSDEFGQQIFHIKEQTVKYRLKFYKNTTLVDSTNEIRFVCDAGTCEVTFQIVEEEDDQSELSIQTSYDNSTGLLDVNWTDGTGETSSVRIHVYKDTMTGSLEICDSSVSSPSGSLQCNASEYTGEVIVNIYTPSTSLVPTINEYVTLESTTLGDFLDAAEYALWSFILLLVFVGMGAVSPVASVITTVFGVFIISLFGLNPVVNVPFVIIVAVIGTAVGVKLKN